MLLKWYVLEPSLEGSECMQSQNRDNYDRNPKINRLNKEAREENKMPLLTKRRKKKKKVKTNLTVQK